MDKEKALAFMDSNPAGIYTNTYSKVKELANSVGLVNGDICKSTGLTKKALEWILENGLIEVSTCGVLADAIGCSISEISLPDYDGYAENVIEWAKDQDRATLSLSQRRTISRVRKFMGEHDAKQSCLFALRGKAITK